MKTTTTHVINEGKTLNYLIPTILCAIASLISFVLFFPLGILLIIICIQLALIETGIEFNGETLVYRKFKLIFGVKRGKWKNIPDPDSFHLRLSVESHTYKTYFPGGSGATFYGGSNSTSKSITYDVLVHTKTGQWIILYEFLSYKRALQFMKHLSSLDKFEVTDHIALKLEENRQKRADRMR
jgi:hypothetical protein